MDVVDYEIKGLGGRRLSRSSWIPARRRSARRAPVFFMDAGIGMEAGCSGDGSNSGGGFLEQRLLGAGKRRLLTGESLFTTVYTNRAGQGTRGLCGALPGQDHPDGPAPARRHADLPEGRLPVRGARVSLGIYFQQRLSTGFLAVRASSWRSWRATAWHSCTLAAWCCGATAAGRPLLLDTGCLVAHTPNVNFEIQYVGKIKTALFGGEGLFLG